MTIKTFLIFSFGWQLSLVISDGNKYVKQNTSPPGGDGYCSFDEKTGKRPISHEILPFRRAFKLALRVYQVMVTGVRLSDGHLARIPHGAVLSQRPSLPRTPV